MVLQDTWLFSGSIYENLVYGSLEGEEEKQEEQVKAAARAAGIDGFIRRLPEGYHTPVSYTHLDVYKRQRWR